MTKEQKTQFEKMQSQMDFEIENFLPVELRSHGV